MEPGNPRDEPQHLVRHAGTFFFPADGGQKTPGSSFHRRTRSDGDFLPSLPAERDMGKAEVSHPHPGSGVRWDHPKNCWCQALLGLLSSPAAGLTPSGLTAAQGCAHRDQDGPSHPPPVQVRSWLAVPHDILPRLRELGQGSGTEAGASHTRPKGSDSVAWSSCLPRALPRQPSTLPPPLPLPSLSLTTVSQHVWTAGLVPSYPINTNYRKSSGSILGKTQFYLLQVWLVARTFSTGLWQGLLGHRTQTGDKMPGDF